MIVAIGIFVVWVVGGTYAIDAMDKRRMEQHVADALALANGADR